MSGLASFGETTALNALFTGRFVSLHTADPGDGGVSEVAGGSYARQSATFTLSGTNPTVASNNAVIQFPVATADWGTVTHFGVWTASVAGSFIGGWPVLASKPIFIEDTARWDVGKMRIGTDETVT